MVLVKSLPSRLGLTLLVAVLLAGFLATEARADVVVSDGFEGSPAGRWEVDTSGDGHGGFDLGTGGARSGANNGWMMAENGGAAEKLWVNTPRSVGQCAASLQVKPSFNDTLVIAEVWQAYYDEASGQQVVRRSNSKDIRLNAGGYQQIDFGTASLYYGATKAQFRLVLAGGGSGNTKVVKLDDLYVRCW
jgi:hypothetical protein